MTTLTETLHAGAFLVSEGNGSISRERITVVSGQDLQAGAVLGKVTASGKYAAYDNGASDGTQAAAGILFASVDASGGDAHGVAVVRLAEVAKAALVFGSGQDATAKTAAYADLAALTIIAR
ncbi:head decoration protein [Pararhodospirillum photometricum]|uniref:Bacteriophage lambda head decoration protein D n=1 Tax=Pararhodospirillum photometricum DSM 122 TaxID=1150469 RepID=H6SMH3_PARPM|nr:head decoration protein [Pararhodospirillum photometricum]CCG09108.1 Putative uncharacterized protein [Pararhodospirillum photometricum DSM 122]